MEDIQETSKLIILYFFDQMEVPLKETIVNDIFSEHSNWIPYTEYRSCFTELLKQNLLYNAASKTADPRYSITAAGREGLSYFYTKIPMSVRDEISSVIKKNRLSYKKKQEYLADYYKNHPAGCHFPCKTPEKTDKEIYIREWYFRRESGIKPLQY